MESTELLKIGDFYFDEMENQRIDVLTEEIIEHIKKQNFAFAEAKEVLKRCGIRLETLKINNNCDNTKSDSCLNRFCKDVSDALQDL